MEAGLFIIFWYGILHAMGPDHLTVIADFSIGKQIKKTAIITLLFALGHGVALFVFAKMLQSFPGIEAFTDYGDMISASVIMLMGVYLLYIVFTDRILFNKHEHNGQEHIHIRFAKKHSHRLSEAMPVFSLAVLMGIGGVRGMLITLGLVNNQEITFTLIAAFVLGVTLVFLLFGVFILAINHYLLNSLTNIKRVFGLLGVTSIAVGAHMLWL